MFGLKSHTIQAIRKVFLEYPDLKKAVLYGSRAKGNYRPGSDIDLTLDGEGLDLGMLHKIENDLDELMLPYKIDISLLRHIKNSELIQHIERVGIVFYERT